MLTLLVSPPETVIYTHRHRKLVTIFELIVAFTRHSYLYILLQCVHRLLTKSKRILEQLILVRNQQAISHFLRIGLTFDNP